MDEHGDDEKDNLLIMLLIINIDRKYWSFGYLVHPNLAWIDGLIRQRMRFTQNYRFILLRSISFAMDLRSNHKAQRVHDSQFASDGRNVSDYSMLHYFAYSLYIPLFVAGPIMSFHDWMSQIKGNITGRNPLSSTDLSYRSMTLYIARFAAVMLVNEWMLHYLYVPLMAQHDPFPLYLDECRVNMDFAFKLLALAMWSFFCVFFLWAKFLLIWRFQRILAMLDGVAPPENMRCDLHFSFTKNLENCKYLISRNDTSTNQTLRVPPYLDHHVLEILALFLQSMECPLYLHSDGRE